MAIAVGTNAPALTLKSMGPEGLVDIDLASEYAAGPVVLLFFPAAFTGVCTQEMCDVSGGVYSIPGAKVFGVSVDSPFAQSAWSKANNISVPLLSDYRHQLVEGFDVVLPDLVGLGPSSKRAAFVVAKDGTVVYSEETATPLDLPNFEAIAASVASL